MMINDSYGFFDVRKMGAAGDGVSDDTAAFQAAVDAAAAQEGIVFVPPGKYLIRTIHAAPRIRICGSANFSFRAVGGSVLIQHPGTENGKALIDITGAFGVQLEGLCLRGRAGSGDEIVHGIGLFKEDYGKEEDTPAIINCRIERFSGDAIHLERVWCFSVRHCHCLGNLGSGLAMRGWDAFVMDNWFSGNYGAGFTSMEENASVTMTGNRIEWNMKGGIVIRRGAKYNITGNYIDRSGCFGIELEHAGDIAVSGNVIYRSGKPEWTDPEKSAHCSIRDCRGVAFTGNSLACGRDDGGQGEFSPVCGLKLHQLENCVIANNTLHECALDEMICTSGDMENCVIENNPGSRRQANAVS